MGFARDETTLPRVVYEDEWLVAIDKPPRMHSAPGLGAGDLCSWAFERFPEAKNLGPELRGAGGRGEGGLLHRLDYETSGLVLFARKAAAFASLLEQQEKGGFYKEYSAIASPSREAQPLGSVPDMATPRGAPPRDWADARAALDCRSLASQLGRAAAAGENDSRACGVDSAFRSFGPRGARVACLEPIDAAKAYLSDILGCSPPSDAPRAGEPGRIELRIGLSRGFRHQIRAHLAWIGLPICGDPIYGGAPDARLRLYAVRLSFAHPETGRALSVSSEDRA